MASSGEVKTNDWNSSGKRLRFQWTMRDHNQGDFIEKNYSIIDYTLTGWSDTHNSFQHVMRLCKLYINGECLYDEEDYTHKIHLTDGLEVASGEFRIQHNPDGTGKVKVHVEAGLYYSEINITADQTWDLDVIPRAAVITYAPNFTDNDKPTIKINNILGNNVQQLSAYMNFDGSDTTHDINIRNIDKTTTMYTYNFLDSELDNLYEKTKNTKSTTIYYILRTKVDGNYYYDKKSATFSIVGYTIEFSPTITSTDTKANGLTGSSTRILRNYNSVKVDFNYQTHKHSILYYLTATIGGTTKNTNPAEFTNISSDSCYCECRDSRGCIRGANVNINMIDYTPLTCNLQVDLPSTDGKTKLHIRGNYYNTTFRSNVKNSLNLYYAYSTTQSGLTNWKSITPTIDNENHTYSYDKEITGLDYTKTYYFQAYATDKMFDRVETPVISVKSTPVFDWSKTDFKFNVPVKADKGLTVNGNLTMQNPLPVGSGGTGNTTGSATSIKEFDGNRKIRVGYAGYGDCNYLCGYGKSSNIITLNPVHPADMQKALKICYGTKNIHFDTGDNTIHIDFPEGMNYTENPCVFTSQVFNNRCICVQTNTISKTGFTAGISGVQASGNRDFFWFAIGK